MQKMKLHLSILIISILTLHSCDKRMPAGFWTKFETDLINEDKSDQGPWGGNRAIYWLADNGDFNIEKINDFAAKNGWTLIDSSEYTTNDLKEWFDNKKPIFPLILTGFEPVKKDSSSFKDFPRWITKELTVYRFKTDWIVVYPGTDDATTENGFVILSKDRKEMTVYHLWGE